MSKSLQAVLAAALVMCLGVGGCSNLPPAAPNQSIQFVAQESNGAEAIVRKILDGTLKPDKQGLVDLSMRIPALSISGKATVTYGKNGQVLIFFPTSKAWFGDSGFLYYKHFPARETVEWPDNRSMTREAVKIRATDPSDTNYTTTAGYKFVPIPRQWGPDSLVVGAIEQKPIADR